MSVNAKKLAGQVAVISGASKGLGKAMALALGAAGVKLALASRDAALLEKVGAEANPAGAEVLVMKTDVTREAEVAQLASAVREKFGGVDILINNAGVNVRKSVTDFTLEEWRLVMDTNLTGTFLACRAFVPLMKGRGGGRIINLTSIMSHVAIAGRTAYAASKAGLLGFTKALALELAPEGINVVGISPGPFATEMNAPLMNNPELSAQFLSKIPLGRWGQPEEVAKLVVYLCSPEAAFITGTDILMDGGWCAQ
jgi:NAD(P)-dependent dehydrogenase (short-subunit alcohol dehydrogenase family)